MSTNNTALLIMDPQNDLIHPDGILYAATQTTLEQNDVIANINKLIKSHRSGGSTIIFSPITFSEGYPEAGENPYGVIASVMQSNAMIKGTWGGDIASSLHREKDDIIIERSNIIAFEETNLETILREKRISRLILCGLLSDVCVEGTMRSGYDKGFEVYTAIDATATLDHKKHEYTVTQNFPMFSKPLSTRELSNLL